ncbi:hypothetical protein AAG906_016979 [Vitis piasezkii]
MRKPFVISGNISEDSFECPNPSHFHPKLAYVPSREEVSELFSRIPFFTEREPLVQDMRVLFSPMQQILVENFLYGILDIIIACIIHMKDYIAFETTKAVEATETMRAYISHSMDGNEELLVSLEMAKSEVDVAQKLVEEGGGPSTRDGFPSEWV